MTFDDDIFGNITRLRRDGGQNTVPDSVETKVAIDPYRDEFIRRTDAMISDIKTRMPKWQKSTLATGIWVFDNIGNKSKRVIEHVCQETASDPRTVITAIQMAANKASYGIMIVANTLMPNVDEFGCEVPMDMEQIRETVNNLNDDSSTKAGISLGLMIYRETRDGFSDIVMFRVKTNDDKTAEYMSDDIKALSVDKLARTIGLKTFGITDEARVSLNINGWIQPGR